MMITYTCIKCLNSGLMPLDYCSFRRSILEKLWKSCKTMFSLGPLERRDAYSILSLYLSFFTYTDECQYIYMSSTAEVFDLRAEKQFWDEMKKGLVCCASTIMCFHCLI